MSATLGVLLKELQPDWNIQIYERLSEVGQESSNPWNNAGTGHAALCELNYTPELPDGSVEIAKAVVVNEQFQLTRQLWSYLVETGAIDEPRTFINPTPHMSFVTGEENVEYLRRRWEALKDHPLFEGMEYTEDARTIRSWAPLLIPGRLKSERFAATRSVAGTDVDFGALTHDLVAHLQRNGVGLNRERRVTGIKRRRDGSWRLLIRRDIGQTPEVAYARFVFVGAGGGALRLLQKSGIKEIRGFGGFPVSGQFLRTDNQELVARHAAKVYGKAAVGSPPMSVPHLDLRVVDGDGSLMFGPYAGFSPKFLKHGSYLDLFATIRWHNIIPMLQAGLRNLGLVRYLLGQLTARKATKFGALREFYPKANPADWYKITAGQRVQVIKRVPGKGGVLQFGTEVVAAADGSIAGLLGASPGASTAVPIMIEVLERCFPDRLAGWQAKLEQMVPGHGSELAGDAAAVAHTLAATAEALDLSDGDRVLVPSA